MTLGQRIKSIRKAKGLTQAELAAKSLVDHSYISRIENDKHQPTSSTLMRIAVALETEPLSLIYIDIETNENDTPERIKRVVECYPKESQITLLHFLETNLSESFKL